MAYIALVMCNTFMNPTVIISNTKDVGLEGGVYGAGGVGCALHQKGYAILYILPPFMLFNNISNMPMTSCGSMTDL